MVNNTQYYKVGPRPLLDVVTDALQILGVNKDATEAEIKKVRYPIPHDDQAADETQAYRVQSLKWHPGRCRCLYS